MNYSFDQVKPIINRILSQLDNLSEAEILAFVKKSETSPAFILSEEGERGHYKLHIFGQSLRLDRDGKTIHESRATVTHLSRILRNSPSCL